MTTKKWGIAAILIAFPYSPGAWADTSQAIAALKKQHSECTIKPQPGCEKIEELYAALAKEVTRIKSSASPPSQGPVKVGTTQSPGPSRDAFQIGPLFTATTSPSPLCEAVSKALFVRADPLDNFHYFVDYQDPTKPTAADAKGLSINYTDDKVAATRTATINGRISYLLWGEQCGLITKKPYISAAGIAPFISSNGTWTDPPAKKPSNSVDKVGVDFAFSLATTSWYPFIDQYVFISPYHQTDFQSRARLDGVALAWEPVAPTFYLGSGGPVTPNYSFFWQLRPEADFIDVSQSGLTNLAVGRHLWVGETVRGTLGLFPLSRQADAVGWYGLIAGRFSLIGTVENFYDTQTNFWANYYSATLQYKLGPCVKDTSGKDPTAPCSIQGSSSISFEYDRGTDKDALVFTKKYLVKLGFAY